MRKILVIYMLSNILFEYKYTEKPYGVLLHFPSIAEHIQFSLEKYL